ncbi:MAG: dephospho-CoA kinase, partial [Pseudomonadota bacterium]
TAALFAEAGVPVWDADAAVHRLYAPGGAGALAIAMLAPGAMDADGGVDRAALRDAIAADPSLLARVEAAVHPLVAEDRVDFIAAADVPAVLLDIPLLFETGADGAFDHVVVVSAPATVQRERVLSRPGMTAQHFEHILARQLPDAEKRRRADTVIDTGAGVPVARAAVNTLLARLLPETRDA